MTALLSSPQWDSLMSDQCRQLDDLLAEFPTGFDTCPSLTEAIEHAIPMAPGVVVRAPWRPLPRK